MAVGADDQAVNAQTRFLKLCGVDRQQARRVVGEVNRQRFGGVVDQVDTLIFGVVGQIADLRTHVRELRDQIGELGAGRRLQGVRNTLKLANQAVDGFNAVESRRNRRNPLVNTVLTLGKVERAVSQGFRGEERHRIVDRASNAQARRQTAVRTVDQVGGGLEGKQ